MSMHILEAEARKLAEADAQRYGNGFYRKRADGLAEHLPASSVVVIATQQAEPGDPTGLVSRLRIHAGDRANTAFARSSMREAAGVLEDQQHAEPEAETAYQTLLEVTAWSDEDWSELFERYPAVRERAVRQAAQQQAEPEADERAAFEKWFGEWCPGFQRASYTAADVEDNVKIETWEAWQASAAQSGRRTGVAGDGKT